MQKIEGFSALEKLFFCDIDCHLTPKNELFIECLLAFTHTTSTLRALEVRRSDECKVTALLCMGRFTAFV